MNLSLDDLYKMTAFIYQDENLGRSREATLLHFVEVCGMLTLIDRKKKRLRVDVAGALCKALGWYFPLLAKMGVESVEHLIFTKYPNACPYCRALPHVEEKCKLVKGESVLSHFEVRELTKRNWDSRPSSLNQWQAMFRKIYPRSLNSGSKFSLIALFEEVGELAEAVRVFDRHPHYFYGEAADVFSYIMGLANEYSLSCEDPDEAFDYETEFLSRYPGLCLACGGRVCVCPTIPLATVGRMAKEMPSSGEGAFNAEEFHSAGRDISERVLAAVDDNLAIFRYLPYDRGDLNADAVHLAIRLSQALSTAHAEVADNLMDLALKLGSKRQGSGAEPNRLDLSALDLLKVGWQKIDVPTRQSIITSKPTIDTVLVLMIGKT